MKKGNTSSRKESESAEPVEVKEELLDDHCLVHTVPTIPGWMVEMSCMSNDKGESVMSVFTEVDNRLKEPMCFLPGTRFLTTEGSFVQVECLSRGVRLQGPEGAVIVDQVSELSPSTRTIVLISINASDTLMLKVAVTDDHRMRLKHNVYRVARDLRGGDMLCTTHGEYPVCHVDLRKELLSVFAATFSGDRSVFMTMEVGNNVGMVAAFGACHQVHSEFIEFRFKGPICDGWNEGGSAELWLYQFRQQLSEFDMRFLATSPYSVWVNREHADVFYDVAKTLLPNRRSRLRCVHPPRSSDASLQLLPWRGLQEATEEQLLNAMPVEYED